MKINQHFTSPHYSSLYIRRPKDSVLNVVVMYLFYLDLGFPCFHSIIMAIAGMQSQHIGYVPSKCPV